MRTVLAMLLSLPLLMAVPAWAQVEVQNPWARATAPGAKVAAGYLVLTNSGAAADRLVSASTPLAARVETHVTQRDGNVMRMREVQGYEIPAGGSFELKPGGAHLMFVDIRQPFRDGDRVPVTLRFEKAGEKTVEFRVTRTAPSPASHGQHGGSHRH